RAAGWLWRRGDMASTESSTVPSLPLTVASPSRERYQIQATIGVYPDRKVYQPNNIAANSYWFLAINRYTLNADYNYVQQSNDAKPAGIDKYDNSDYMLVLATYALGSDRL